MTNVYYSILLYNIVIVVGIKNMASTTEKKCKICEKFFPEQIFNLHQRMHIEDKFHPCNTCQKMFFDKSSLTEHLRIHTGKKNHVKPYKCSMCEKTFCLSVHLANHTRIHTGEKPYECEICKKTFSISSNLTNHRRVHKGEKPYSCDVCQKSFAEKSTLSKHNKRPAHIKRMESKNTNVPITSFVDEDIKEEVKEEENVEVPSFKQHERGNVGLLIYFFKA